MSFIAIMKNNMQQIKLVEIGRLIIEFIVIPIFIFAANKIDKLTDSINALNTQVAVIIQQTSNTDKRIDRIEEKVFKR